MEYNMENLIKLFENNNDMTFIVDRDLAFDLVESLEIRGHRFCEGKGIKDVQELYESSVLMVSRYESFGKEECFFEVAYGDRHLKYIEGYQLAIIEEGAIEPWEIKGYVRGGYVLFNYIEDEELDEMDEFIEDIMNELLGDLENLDGSISALDLIKESVKEAYETGYKDGIRDCTENLTNKLNEQF
ncbi:hypothetical protein [uncultured Clostridium sp.]|uniref:hypothetical protein n=1 Tax=uncultured Clostridium sp. TaxID=59620 RepID=UPI003216F894